MRQHHRLVTSTLTTEAFGNLVAQWGNSANPYRFAGAWGYRDDGDAVLPHVGARYYDPQVGRFISRDAVLSEHPYLYCEHEPVNSVDPDGEASWFVGPEDTSYRIDWSEKPYPDMHIYHPGGETNVSHLGGWKRGWHHGRKLVPLPKYLRKLYRPIIRRFVKSVAKRLPVIGLIFVGYEVYQVYRDPNSDWWDYLLAVL